MKRLVLSVLDYVEFESGNLKINQQWISLEEVIGSVIGQLKNKADGHRMLINIPANMHFMYTDELILARVLSNLVSNAINYSPQNSTIYIQAELVEQIGYQIKVIDEGKGIPIDMQERIFERFTRLQKESNIPGLGLGLSLSRDLIKTLGGDLKACDNNMQTNGACFCITLPLPDKDIFDKFENAIKTELAIA